MSTEPNSPAGPDIITTDENSAKIAEILPKLSALQTALETQNPNINGYMKAINENLRQFPELVHLLSLEQIKPIYSAIRAQTQVVISAKIAKKSAKKPSASESAQIMSLL